MMENGRIFKHQILQNNPRTIHATCFAFTNSAASYRASSRQLKRSPSFSIVFSPSLSLSLSGGCDVVPPLENVISRSLLFRKCLELACNAQTCKTCMKYVRACTHPHPHPPRTRRAAACKSSALPPHSHTHTARRCNRQQLAFPKLQ